jgi:hypothetical protein
MSAYTESLIPREKAALNRRIERLWKDQSIEKQAERVSQIIKDNDFNTYELAAFHLGLEAGRGLK